MTNSRTARTTTGMARDEQRQPETWSVLDANSEQISRVEASYADSGFTLHEVPESKGQLKGYFFHQGQRHAALAAGDLVIPGRLVTRWENGQRVSGCYSCSPAATRDRA